VNIKNILKSHKLWVNTNGMRGTRANLQGKNLSRANLQGADLQGADLQGADLWRADLQGTNLQGANLSRADLQKANLQKVNLQRANLQGASLWKANLSGADLWRADLQRADLQDADMQDANLQDADLRGADLRGADLKGADLQDADLREATLPHYQIVPSEGDFIAYKKVEATVIKVLCRGKRVSTLVGRKIRVEKVKVLDSNIDTFNLRYGNSISTRYQSNKWTTCNKFDDDIKIECTHGIHVFLTKKEAEEF